MPRSRTRDGGNEGKKEPTTHARHAHTHTFHFILNEYLANAELHTISHACLPLMLNGNCVGCSCKIFLHSFNHQRPLRCGEKRRGERNKAVSKKCVSN